MKKYFKYVLVLGIGIFSLINPLKVSAQPADPSCDPLDPACPIDGGLSLLIAAGIGIGAKKAYDKKRKNTEM